VSQSAPTVRLAVLADFAQAHHDGRFQIVGGGVRSLTFPVFPARLERISLALALDFTPDQVPGQDQKALLSIDSSDPGGDPFVPRAATTPRPLPIDAASSQLSFSMVANWTNLVFTAPGMYWFVVSFREKEISRVPLLIEQGQPPVEIDLRPWELALYEGVTAFNAGQVDLARSHFERLTKSFPGVAEAWNNLGFVQLTSGASKRAYENFVRARDLGFAKPEIMAVNLGCAAYVRGEYVDAVNHFSEAIRTQTISGPAILYAITRAGLNVIQVTDARTFLSLAFLNLAWTEARQGDVDTAKMALASARDIASTADAEPPQWLLDSAEELGALLAEAGPHHQV
jgi:hypothetical protein